MLNRIVAPLAAMAVLTLTSGAVAQDAEVKTAVEVQATDSTSTQTTRREWRGGAPAGVSTTASLERSFNRRMAAWEAAKIPAEKIEKAKEIQAKVKAALEAGKQDEIRTLARSTQDLLTPEEREAVQAQMRGSRRGPLGNDSTTTITTNTTDTIERRRGRGMGPR